jgi:hypothetical protein
MLTEPLRIWLISFTVDLARYLLVAGPAFLVFLVWGWPRLAHRSILGTRPKLAKMLHDLRWSLSTVTLFSLIAVGVVYGGRSGVFRRYSEIADYGWTWFVLSVGVLIVLQDTYFYWTHRAMHHRWLFRLVHRVHHQSIALDRLRVLAARSTRARCLRTAGLAGVAASRSRGVRVSGVHDHAQRARPPVARALPGGVHAQPFLALAHHDHAPRPAPRALHFELWPVLHVLGRAHGHDEPGLFSGLRAAGRALHPVPAWTSLSRRANMSRAQ